MRMSKQMTLRKNTGSAGSLLIIAGGLLALLTALMMLIFHVQLFFLNRQRIQAACDAAALAVSHELSRIVIEDPDWGFVSLSDQAACGRATVAVDGEPLPVSSINTVLGTDRLQHLLGERISSNSLANLIDEDSAKTKTTVLRLQSALEDSLDRLGKRQFKDLNGEAVRPYVTARSIFERNIPDIKAGKARVKDFRIRLGWLQDGSTTVTPDPLRTGDSAQSQADFYRAFSKLPAGGREYYFAGVSQNGRLVKSERFRSNDGKHFNSAVLIEAEIDYLHSKENGELETTYTIAMRAAALPPAGKNTSASGSLIVYFPQGTIKKFKNLRSLLEASEFERVTAQSSRAVKGDFPKDMGSELVPSNELRQPVVSQSIARGVLDWLKTNNGKTRLSAVLEILERPFDTVTASAPGTVAIFDFDKNGNALLSHYSNGGFFKQTVSENQSFDIVYGACLTEKGSIGLSVRNHVNRLGREWGGRHAGQPLFTELPVNYDYPSADDSPEDKEASQCRTSFRKGGLAVSIEMFAG